MARKSKQLERLEQDRAGRAYLTGFAVGYCLGRREAMKELRSIGNEFEAEFEALSDSCEPRSTRRSPSFVRRGASGHRPVSGLRSLCSSGRRDDKTGTPPLRQRPA